MKIFSAVSILILASSLAAAGCKKKEDAASGAVTGSATGSAAKAADTPAPAATPPAAPATPPAAPAEPAAPAAGGLASDEEYFTKATDVMTRMTEVFKADGANCDKLADDITKFATDNQAMLAALRAYDKAHPEAEKKFSEASKPKMTEFQTAVGPAMGACKDNKKLADAMKKLGPG